MLVIDGKLCIGTTLKAIPDETASIFEHWSQEKKTTLDIVSKMFSANKEAKQSRCTKFKTIQAKSQALHLTQTRAYSSSYLHFIKNCANQDQSVNGKLPTLTLS